MEVCLKYQIDDDFETLKLSGNLIRVKEDKLGIEWVKEEGNDFWLQAIISRLNT